MVPEEQKSFLLAAISLSEDVTDSITLGWINPKDLERSTKREKNYLFVNSGFLRGWLPLEKIIPVDIERDF